MPLDSKPPAPEETTAAKSYDLYCPACGKKIINYAQHPTLEDHTIAYSDCNPYGPVLDYPTNNPPAQYMTPPQAAPDQGQAGDKEKD